MRILISTLLLASTGSLCSSLSQLEVTAVRFWTMPEVTRIAVETSGEFKFKSDRVSNPDRLFFDILGAVPRMPGKGVHTTIVGDKLLKQIRVAQTQPGMTRVVLDLAAPVDFTASLLTNPDRLIVELKPASPAPVPAPAPITSVREAEPSPAQVASSPAVFQKPALEQAPPAQKMVLAEPPSMQSPSMQSPSMQSAPLRTASIPRPSMPALPPPLAAKRNSSGDRTLIRALGLKVGRVVIDPGHGGHDRGSTGPGGLMEKELVLDVALRLGALVEQRLGSEVIYTRKDDTFIPLEGRTEMANEMRADLFISIHANSSPYPGVAGVETYYLNFDSNREAMDLASRENAGSQETIFDLPAIIEKITKHDKAEESREFAAKMQAALYSAAARSNPAARNRGVRKAPFIVLIGATMPSILAEIGFLSNAREESLLKRPEHRQRLAEALYNGLERYATTLSHFQVAARD